MPLHDKWFVCVYVQMYVGSLHVLRVTTGWAHNLQTLEITSYENGKMGECIGKTAMWYCMSCMNEWMCVGVCVCPCVFFTHPNCQGCLWRSTWGWHQCLDRREVSACHSPPDLLCPREPTPPDMHTLWVERAARRTKECGEKGNEKDKRKKKRKKRKRS